MVHAKWGHVGMVGPHLVIVPADAIDVTQRSHCLKEGCGATVSRTHRDITVSERTVHRHCL